MLVMTEWFYPSKFIGYTC